MESPSRWALPPAPAKSAPRWLIPSSHRRAFRSAADARVRAPCYLDLEHPHRRRWCRPSVRDPDAIFEDKIRGIERRHPEKILQVARAHDSVTPARFDFAPRELPCDARDSALQVTHTSSRV